MSFNPMLNETTYNNTTLVNPKLSGTVTVGDYTLPATGEADNKVLTGTSATASAWEYSPVPVLSMICGYNDNVIAKNIGDYNFLNRITAGGQKFYTGWNGSDRWILVAAATTSYSLNDGGTWITCANSISNPSVDSRVSYDSSTGLWVATSAGSLRIWWSNNGNNWTGLGSTNNFNAAGTRVANDNNGNWVICGYGGNTVVRSSNPVATANLVPFGTTLLTTYGVACVYANGLFLVGGSDTTNRISWSSNAGVSWASQTSAHTTQTTSLCYSPKLNIWVSGGYGTYQLGYNTDPTTQAWTGTLLTEASKISDICWDGTRFIACNFAGKLYYSYDGISWTFVVYNASRLDLTPTSNSLQITSKIYPRT